MSEIPTVTYLEDDTINEKCGHNFKIITGTLTFTTYSGTTGVTFDLRKQIPTKVHIVRFDNPAGYVLTYDYTNRRILVYEGSFGTASAPTEVNDNTDLSTALASVRFLAIGK